MSRRMLLLTATVISLVAMPGAAVATEPALDLDDAVSVTSDIDPAADEFGAVSVEPDPAIVDRRPHAWDRVVVSADGRALDIYFWGGVEDCYGLHSVEVTEAESGVNVLLMSGQQPDLGDVACIEIAQLFVTTVTLDTPLIGNVE